MTDLRKVIDDLEAALEQLRSVEPEVDRAARAILASTLRLADELAVADHLKREPARKYLTEAQVAERLGCSKGQLAGIRRSGGGAKFIRNGRAVLYVTKSVLDWEETLAVDNTSADCVRKQRKGVR